MDPFKTIKSKVTPLDIINVDTDQIVPKQFLKLIRKSGYGNFLFYEWRFDQKRNLKNDFILNDPKYAGRPILLTRENFGCGSSREHAVWALFDYGFRVILAPSFADIFYNNCFKTGMLPIVLDREEIDYLFSLDPDDYVEVNLMEQTLSTGRKTMNFKIDSMKRRMLLEGTDEIGYTLQLENWITDYEKRCDSESFYGSRRNLFKVRN
jgi:3-isopropylmalate/(R)-2-methylmalate dehydratase small subunit